MREEAGISRWSPLYPLLAGRGFLRPPSLPGLPTFLGATPVA